MIVAKVLQLRTTQEKITRLLCEGVQGVQSSMSSFHTINIVLQ